MSQTRDFPASKVNTSRSDGTGTGTSHTARVGKWGTPIYKSHVQFTHDWTNVGRLIRAEMVLTTSDNFAQTTDHPTAAVRLLRESWSEGTGSTFNSSDYRSLDYYTSPVASKEMEAAVDTQTSIDITDLMRYYLPKSAGGYGRTNLGFLVSGSSISSKQYEFYSDEEATVGFRPKITITFEYTSLPPDTPITGLSPVGDVAAIDAFEADFVDSLAPEETLQSSHVQVYAPGAVKSGTANSTTNLVTSTAHGLAVGDMIWFHSLTGGSGLNITQPWYVRTVPSANTFSVATAPGGSIKDIVTNYSALTFARPLWSITKQSSDTERVAAHSFVLPTGLHVDTNTAYQWRIRQQDNTSLWSAWSALQTFTVTNTDPNAPTGLSPDSGDGAANLETLNGVIFRGTFSDPDVGDTLLAFQVQLSDIADPDSLLWEDASQLKWDSGKVYVPDGTTEWEIAYGGADLTMGTWYWRARQWDQNGGLSDWSRPRLSPVEENAYIVLDNDFDADPGSQTSIQVDSHAPWRVRIREMKFNSLASITGAITGANGTELFTSAKNHGLTAGRKVRFSSITGGTGLFTDRTYWVIASGLTAKTFKLSEEYGGTAVDFTTNVTAAVLTGVTTRGPGNTVAIIENAKSVGASIVYNSPGEAHFTLPIDHPMISVIEPKQVHYGIDFYTGDGWRETFAGLVWDLDASERDAVFPCLDYLALFDTIYDSRYYPADPDRSSGNGGSKYVNSTISTIVTDQLRRAIAKANSPVGFITLGAIDPMGAKVTIWSTMQPTLSFVASLLDSHREGTGKRTRVSVKRTGPSTYTVVVEDDPGSTRDNLRLRYGELVNGYRVILFGDGWASVVHGIGRTREGTQVLYKTANAPGVDPRVWGNIERAVIMDNVSDSLDLTRRLKQEAIKSGKIGQHMAVAVRVNFLKPLDGYNICDALPVAINHGAINTANFGSGYFNIWAVAWEAGDDASQQVILTLLPREDTVAAAEDIIDAVNISTQAEWQIGYTPPDPIATTAKYYLDQTTGIVYFRSDTDAQTGLSGEAEP